MATYEKDVNAFSEISSSQIFALFGQLIAYLGTLDDTTFQLYDSRLQNDRQVSKSSNRCRVDAEG